MGAKHRAITTKEKYFKAKDTTSNFERQKKAAQAKADKASKEFKHMQKEGLHVTAHGVAAQRELANAKADLEKATAAFKKATQDLPHLEEAYNTAKEKISAMQEKRREAADKAAGVETPTMKKPAAAT